MIVVSDTTALTTLLKVGREDLLRRLFGTVLLPPAVERELRCHHDALPAWCQVRPVMPCASLDRLLAEADVGEAEAICLAAQAGADVLLIDDRKGRRLAEREGVRCLGLPAVLLAAKEQRLLGSLGELLGQLERRGNFRLSARLREELLRRAGE